MAGKLAIFYSRSMRLGLHLVTKAEHTRPRHPHASYKNAMKIEAIPLSPEFSAPAKRRWRKPAIGLLVVLLAGGGWAALRSRPAAAPAAPAGKDAPKVEVYELAASDVATVQARELARKLPLSGSLVPLAQATIKSKVSGVVQGTAVQEGMQVAAGQVIARIDAADQRARVAQQQAALNEANARLSLAQKNNANSAALLKQSYISQNAYDTTHNSVELAQAAVDAARAQLELARIALADTAIRAPLSGVVSKRFVQAGDKVSPDTPVFSIVDLRQMTLEASVPASDIPRVQVGQEVLFKVDGLDARSFAGTVARISPTTEPGSRAMIVYAGVDNQGGVLRGGMFAKGGITIEKSASHPLVPLAALRRIGARDVVYLVDGGKVVAQPVELGLRNEDEGLAEVTGGLQAGAVVISAQLEGVKPGAKVKIAGAAAPAPAAATAAKKG
jgi:RND family efflux transporter MFP subunit